MASYDQNKAFRAYPSARLLRSFGFSPQVFLDTSCLVPLTTLHSHQKLSFKFSGPGLDRRQVQSSHTASAKLFGATPLLPVAAPLLLGARPTSSPLRKVGITVIVPRMLGRLRRMRRPWGRASLSTMATAPVLLLQ